MAGRRRRKDKQPVARINIITTVLGLLSLAVFFLIIRIASQTAGSMPKAVAGIGLVSFVLALWSVWNGKNTLKNVEYNTVLRITGFVFPLLATIVWLFIYVYGIFVF